MQGKANVQVNRASDGYSLFSAGNYTFSATVTDSGQNGTTGKRFSLIVYDASGVPYPSVPVGTPLQGGNVVVHSHQAIRDEPTGVHLVSGLGFGITFDVRRLNVSFGSDWKEESA